MSQSDRLELALVEIEKARAAQDAELKAVFAQYDDLGPTMLPLDAHGLRQLSECSICEPCEQSLGANRWVPAFERC